MVNLSAQRENIRNKTIFNVIGTLQHELGLTVEVENYLLIFKYISNIRDGPVKISGMDSM